jgi:DNA modification methylase
MKTLKDYEYYRTDLGVLYCGDCLKIMPLMHNKFNIVITSPPYNRKRNDKYDFYDDTIDDYFKFLCEAINLILERHINTVFFNIQKNYYNKNDVFDLLSKYKKDIKDIIIWEKSNPMPSGGYNMSNSYEFIICMGNYLKANSKCLRNVITTSVAKMPKEHKAVMNEKISEFLISNFTWHKADTVFDPFFGTGTTGISAMKHGLYFAGIEKSEKYCEMAKKRIETEANQLKLFK